MRSQQLLSLLVSSKVTPHCVAMALLLMYAAWKPKSIYACYFSISLVQVVLSWSWRIFPILISVFTVTWHNARFVPIRLVIKFCSFVRIVSWCRGKLRLAPPIHFQQPLMVIMVVTKTLLRFQIRVNELICHALAWFVMAWASFWTLPIFKSKSFDLTCNCP